MELVRVKSSHVASVGYDPDTRVIRVVFQDGGVYEYPEQGEQVFREMLAAASIGRFLRERLGAGRKIGDSVKLREGSRELFVVEPDECCCAKLSQSLGKGYQGKTWLCPKCGCEWVCDLYPIGAEHVSHWRPNPVIMVF